MRAVPNRPFTVAEASEFGWTSSALRHAVRTGRLRHPRRGIYAADTLDLRRLAAQAAAIAYPQGVVSHRAAALLHGLPLVASPTSLPELTVPPRTKANLPDVHVHRARLRPQDVHLIDGIAVTSPARTLIDLGRMQPVRTAVAAMDAALHEGVVETQELEDVLTFCSNWPGVRRARRAVALSDAKAESPLESVSRLTIADHGLPTPRLQVTILDQFGRFVARADFYWDEFGVVGEADGRAKYDERSVLTAEKARQELLEELGVVVARWGWDEAMRRQNILTGRLDRAFERGRMRDQSGFPRLWML